MKINKRFQDALRPLTDSELSALEASILKDGILDPVVIWRDQIVDGHHRHAIAQKHKMETPVRCRTFKDEDDALAWIKRNQAARRNLNEHQLKLVIAAEYEAQKKEEGRPEKRVQNEPVSDSDPTKTKAEPQRTSEAVAESHGVSPSTVKRSVKYAEAFAKLPNVVKSLIEEKPSLASEACVLKMATMTESELIPIARDVRVGNVKRFDDVVKPSKNGDGKTKQVSRAKPTAEKPAAKSAEQPKPAKPAPKQTAKQFADALIKDHIRPLAKGLDQLAKLTGEKGKDHVAGVSALDRVLTIVTKMGAK